MSGSKELKSALNGIEDLLSVTSFSSGPKGNIGRYSDSALRNWIWDRDQKRTQIDFVPDDAEELYNYIFSRIKRIDFSNWDRPWAAYEEDFTHINENLNVTVDDKQKLSNLATTTLTRRALDSYKKKNLKEADSLARYVRDVRAGADPTEVPVFNDYLERFKNTITILPFYRKLRQAELSLQYLSKAKHKHEQNEENYQAVEELEKTIQRRGDEATIYLRNSTDSLQDTLEAVKGNLEKKNKNQIEKKQIDEIFDKVHPFLTEIYDNIKDRRYNESKISKKGEELYSTPK